MTDGKKKGFRTSPSWKAVSIVLALTLCVFMLSACEVKVDGNSSSADTETTEKVSKFSEIEAKNLTRAKQDYLTGETVKKIKTEQDEGEYFVVDYGDVTYAEWEVRNMTFRMFKIPGRNIECLAGINAGTMQCWQMKTNEDDTLDTTQVEILDTQIPGW